MGVLLTARYPFSTYTHTHTHDQQSIIFDCQNPFSGTAEFRSKISGSTVLRWKEKNYAEKLVIID